MGIFVFRVNKDLFFAPVFFINGSIKGTDLFYCHSTKRFVPLNERWLEYLIGLSESYEGNGVPISERTNTRRQLNLQNITMPPQTMVDTHKYASTAESLDAKSAAHTAWQEMQAVIPALPSESLLRKFIVNDGGFNAMKKIAAVARRDRPFATALHLASSPANYMPDIPPVKAASAPTPWLTLYLDVLHNPSVKSASTADLHRGYAFTDNRPKEAINEVIYEAPEEALG